MADPDRWSKDFSPRGERGGSGGGDRPGGQRPGGDRGEPRRRPGGEGPRRREDGDRRDAGRGPVVRGERPEAASHATDRNAAAPRVPVVPAKAEPQTFDATPRTTFDPNDLMALAQMDPSELRALMDGNLGRKRLEVGSRVNGPVTRIGRETVFLDLGGKSEGQLERLAVPDAKLGDELVAYVSEVDENGIHLELTLSGRAAAQHLEEARISGSPVDGKVASRNQGGFEVRIGSARAFCPTSLISRLPEVDLDAFVGQTLQFKVIETGEKTVVSRRILQEEEAEKRAASLWGTLEVGQQHRGTVRSVQDFGFFVDLGGLDGLVPRREISWASADPRTAVRVGQSVEVVILQKDDEKRKLTLSVKALEADPWTQVGTVFQEGGIYRGTVVKLETFGAFVELAAGLQGLLHVSKLPADVAAGAAIDVRLLSIDTARRRLELSPASAGDTPTDPNAKVTGTVAEVRSNGVVVLLSDGRSGWLPEGECDLPAGTVLAQRFRRGKPIEARVVRDDRSKPVLSVKEALDDEERSWRAHQAQSQPKAKAGGGGGGGFGTLGDLLGGLKLKK